MAICQTYLDIAYENFVYNLRQYAGIVPEEEYIIEVIETNKITAAYFSSKDEYTYSDVVVEVIATAARYSHSIREKIYSAALEKLSSQEKHEKVRFLDSETQNKQLELVNNRTEL